jgi:hypothetical protein
VPHWFRRLLVRRPTGVDVNDRLALEPLWRYVQRRHRPRHDTDDGTRLWGPVVFGRSHVGDVVGVSPRVVGRWGRAGLTVWEADRAAVACGTHPANVWPDWWALCGDEEGVA